MPKSKSLDFREAVLAAYDRGDGTMAELASLFGTSVSSIVRRNALRNAGEDLAPLPHSGGRAHQKIFEEHRLAMAAWLEDEPDLTLPELAAHPREILHDHRPLHTLPTHQADAPPA